MLLERRQKKMRENCYLWILISVNFTVTIKNDLNSLLIAQYVFFLVPSHSPTIIGKPARLGSLKEFVKIKFDNFVL